MVVLVDDDLLRRVAEDVLDLDMVSGKHKDLYDVEDAPGFALEHTVTTDRILDALEGEDTQSSIGDPVLSLRTVNRPSTSTSMLSTGERFTLATPVWRRSHKPPWRPSNRRLFLDG